jgi:DNA polymerase-1
MQKLFLIDAHALIYRAYYAFIKNPRINSKQLNTSAIFGFTNILFEVLRSQQPTHIAVAFDPVGKTFRHEQYEQYKAQRQAMPEDIKRSIPYIKHIVEAMNIPILEVAGYEADDVIGTIAKKAEKSGFEVFMLTPDKDYGQLVSEHIFMYRPRHNGGYETLDVEGVRRKFEITSVEQLIDLLGIMGDASDNIPGCPGVGEKTAVKLLKEFDSINNLLNNTDKIKGALKNRIEVNAQQILFSRFLATIKTDVPIEFEAEKMKIQNFNEIALKELFNELEFKTLSAKILGITVLQPQPTSSKFASQMLLFDDMPPSDPKKNTSAENLLFKVLEPSDSELNSIHKTSHNYILVDTKDKRNELIANLLLQHSVCFDTETTGTDEFNSQLVGLSFCYKQGEAYYVNLPDNQQDTFNILREFSSFFASENIEKIGQNMKFDLLILQQYSIEVCGMLFDTMIAHYLLQPELRHGMDYLAQILLNYKTIHYDELFEQKTKDKNIRKVNLELLKDYACEDADITFQLKQILENQLSENQLNKLFYEIEMPLMKVLAKMETNGVRIDIEELTKSSQTLTTQMNSLDVQIQTLAGKNFNVSSPKQVGEILFDKLKIDSKAKKTKTGQYTTSEDVLEKLQYSHPIVAKILEYRGLKKLLNTYIDALPLLVNQRTGKIHTSYNQTVTSTGRLSSSNPNLQNIPVRDALGKEIRRAFIPDDNSLFFSADYSQVELRIMAHLSEDENMIAAFKSGHDIHAATAAKIFGVDIKSVTTDMRRKAKTANFGIIYGISAFGLSERLNISRIEAKTLIDGYFATYPKVKQYMEQSIQMAKDKGFVETILGRKSRLPDINSQNSIVRNYAERFAINAPIQGSAADIIKIAMVNIQQKFDRQGLKAKMIMQVHDELNFTIPKYEVEQVKALIINEMENAYKLSVPLIADCSTGNNWLEAH